LDLRRLTLEPGGKLGGANGRDRHGMGGAIDEMIEQDGSS
jgi:hypothetical protein